MSERLDQLNAGEQALTAWDGKNEATWNAQHNAKSLTDILLAFRHSREALARRLDDLPEEMVEEPRIILD